MCEKVRATGENKARRERERVETFKQGMLEWHHEYVEACGEVAAKRLGTAHTPRGAPIKGRKRRGVWTWRWECRVVRV